MNTTIEVYRGLVEERLADWTKALPDDPLYHRITYLLGLPAKRVRPVATLMGCALFGGDPRAALDQALGIELFHNFTLMHDDIMDQAPLRRSQPTVHTKWNTAGAILSGDALLVMAYQLMGTDPRVLPVFSQRALEVCEGQEMDMGFETSDAVGVDDYLEMIRLKTAALLAGALEVGALRGGASEQDAKQLGRFGEHLGLAFQLRDDLLDAFGDPEKVGKRPGGDLRAGKKTFLLIRGLERSQELDRTELQEELMKGPEVRDVQRMLRVLVELGVPADTEAEVERHHRSAIAALDAVPAAEENKTPLRELADLLLQRAH
ncbi:MAG: polyprenyl synthetase family protein [Flavobacteriales bacterium]|nr:polyprenyl synthetase family protein [Flavobacteriales bacterium]MCB9166750.1 polyprenyl synthetase family protein [Flavobacteriales bacterium]